MILVRPHRFHLDRKPFRNLCSRLLDNRRHHLIEQRLSVFHGKNNAVVDLPRTVLHHSDRGSQYTSAPFQRLLADHGVTCSMSRAGNLWDNAVMESFFFSLKTERTAARIYRTRAQAKADVFNYIECFCNPWRRHSTLGHLSPMVFEKQAGLA